MSARRAVRARHVVAAAVVLLAACAPRATVQPAPAPYEGAGILARREIASVRAATAYEVVQRLRPRALRGAGGRTVAVYSDGVPVGGVLALRDIPARRVRAIIIFDAAEATRRWGPGNEGGALLVITGRD